MPQIISDNITFRSLFGFSLVIGLTLLAVAFVVFQARYLLIGPQITVVEAPEGPQSERQVFISGTAYNISHLWLNDRQIYTDPQGNFKEAIVLENGYTVVTLRAEDRYGRSSEITRDIVFSPSSFIR